MENLKYKGILYFIATVIAATLCIQVYWNYKNDRTSKQQLLNDVQTSLDNAVDQYYTQLATEKTFSFIGDSLHFTGFDPMKFSGDTLIMEKNLSFRDSSSKGLAVFKSVRNDSVAINISLGDSTLAHSGIFALRDSLRKPVETLSSKIMVSFSEDQLSLQKLDSLLQQELQRKSIAIDYGLTHTLFLGREQTLRPEIVEKASLETASNSPYFFHGNQLKVYFTNITFSVLKRNLLGIVLSFLLVSGVIACLLYLLKIIKQQKQLAEVKNDLISNITHEFKTPIATLGIALESIQNFNEKETSEKTLRYTQISREQVEKLNTMVEKLLETASLDSEQLTLKYSPTDLVALLERAAQKEALLESNKHISFHTVEKELILPLDAFHFENAINNIVDNAIKYGGNTINIELTNKEKSVEISITDSGHSLSEAHQKHVFEKFYRVPKGNTHDVKGFGIGLYYTKKIVEKHQGTIALIPQPQTTFKIVLPHG